ncbi:hypothetical protein P3W24_12890 [Luteibacter sp. PPL201]|uniref:Uncharacterized protein n=1 Tax=Luteibacter sahnii TaxID=3021977 RepID=A0ABT6BCK9_9GAMM|nr:hypothetical protein [Luteibacter sp. PPL193]MDY1549289.1 hypothetical protein [Luteibacter sp. PPL193]
MFRLTVAMLLVASATPAFAAGASMSLWDQIWLAITGKAPVQVADAGHCDNPRECNISFK